MMEIWLYIHVPLSFALLAALIAHIVLSFFNLQLVIGMGLITSQSTASTRPSADRVTFFFTRVKKKVTKKESTLRSAKGFTHESSYRLRRFHLRVPRGSSRAFAGSLRCFFYCRSCLTTTFFQAPTSWTGAVRAFADLHDVKPGAPTGVLSFGDFSLHGQRKVTRSPKASGSSCFNAAKQSARGRLSCAG